MLTNKSSQKLDSLKRIILKQKPELESKLDKMILQKKKEMDSRLGRKGSINDEGACYKIIEEYGLSLSDLVDLSDESDLQKYIRLRNNVREQNLFIWNKLEERIKQLKKETEVLTPDGLGTLIAKDIDKALEELDVIVQSVFPENDLDWKNPKNFEELEGIDVALNEEVPKSLRSVFNKLFTPYLKIALSGKMRIFPRISIIQLIIQFNNENLELRYPNPTTNPYLNPEYIKALKIDPSKYDWLRNGTDELYHYYSLVGQLERIMRNEEEHKEDPLSSIQFELAQRKEIDPVSGINHPGNYIVLSNLVVLSIYEFVQVMQIWVDTCVRIKLNQDVSFSKEEFLKQSLESGKV